MFDITVVSGTFNRLSLLKEMVDSVRKSFQTKDTYGLTYEIVLVDGGSTDGTISWCKQQKDIFLIEHGSLKGAVKAFNEGAFAAKGRYVVLANDDVVFIQDSVFRAYCYMENNLDCGMGCFYQDRNRQEQPDHIKWHVEHMPAVLNNTQVSVVYGQVCIVPKWLGDRVGWWGNYLHTYGGDNELSSQIYQLGFKVSPIPGTKIHDTEYMDDLRRKNNINGHSDPRAIRGHHPDSWAWGKRWRNERKNLVGPVIRETIQIENENYAKERIVYLPIYEDGWEIQKQQKYGLRKALSEIGLVHEISYVPIVKKSNDLFVNTVREACLKFDPTILLTQIHNLGEVQLKDLQKIKQSLNKEAIFVNWNGDFWPDNLLSKEGLLLAKVVDLQLVLNRQVLDSYREEGINAEYWQIGCEPEGMGCGEFSIDYDVVFLANNYSRPRRKLVEFIRSIPGIRFGLFGQGWPEGWALGQTLYNFSEGCRIYRSSKLAIADNNWPESGWISNRVIQAMGAGGSALVTRKFRDCDQLGLYDGKTCVLWENERELREKIQYYLSNESERESIAKAGEQLVLESHTFEVRVRELLTFLGRERSKIEREETLDWRDI